MKEILVSLLAPLTFEKMHGCVPDKCKCRDQKELISPFKPDIYLRPMARAAKKILKGNINLVSSKHPLGVLTMKASPSIQFSPIRIPMLIPRIAQKALEHR